MDILRSQAVIAFFGGAGLYISPLLAGSSSEHFGYARTGAQSFQQRILGTTRRETGLHGSIKEHVHCV